MYSSSIVFILPMLNGSNLFCDNSITVWNDRDEKILAEVKFTESVYDFQISKYCLLVFLQHKILIFDIHTLQYLLTLEDVDSDLNKISCDINKQSPLTIAYCSRSNKNHIKIVNCIFSFYVILISIRK